MTGVPPSGSGLRPFGVEPQASQAEPLVPNASWLIDRYDGVPVDFSERGAGFIEGYAAGLAGLTYALVGEPDAGKSYDPMTVRLERGAMWSYVFDMKDGGRSHPLSQYTTYNEIANDLLLEALETLTQEPELTASALAGLAPAVEAAIEARSDRRPCPWCDESGCDGGCYAQGIEAGTATTAKQGVVHESPVANGDAPTPQPNGGNQHD